MAIQGLIILTGTVPGIRDLFWVDDPQQEIIGYAPFRSEDRGSNWQRLSEDPIPGCRYRDESSLGEVDYTLKPEDWCERGATGFFTFKVPESPIYSKILDGRVLLASQPQDVQVWIDDVPIMPARVDGFDGTIWLPKAFGLVRDGALVEQMIPQVGDSSVVRVHYHRLANYVNPTPETRSYYTVVPVLSGGVLAHIPGAPGTEITNTLEVDKPDYLFSALVTKNSWLFGAFGEPAHLLLKRTRGKRCGCVVEGQARTGCTSCYETGIVGGYYGPYDFLFIDPDVGAVRELNEGGVKVTRQSRSYLGPVPVVQAGDLILRKNGERLVIGTPVYKSPRGVLLQQDFDVILLPSGDTRYRVPFHPPLVPDVYHPAFEEPKPGEEPVSNPLEDPTKVWENTNTVPIGRTVQFGNIMS